MDYTNAESFAVKMVAEAGLWIETGDGKYRAYVFINKIAANTVTISAKRYAL